MRPYPDLGIGGLAMVLCLGLLACASRGVGGQETPAQQAADPRQRPLPAGGVALLGDDPLQAVQIGGPAAARATLTRVPVEGMPFNSALRLDTGGRTWGPNQIMLTWDIGPAIPGDALLFLRFHARLIETQDESGEGRLIFRLPKKQGAALVLGQQGRNFGKEWERFDEPLTLRSGGGPDQGQLLLAFGNADRQVIEIGGVELMYFLPPVTVSDLPFRRITYDGREPDAPWRQEALDRIERHRKADLAIHVVDAGGRPIPDVQVQVKMTRHAYGFGTMVHNRRLLDNPVYRDNLLKHFNLATLITKWMDWDVFGPTHGQVIDILRSHNFRFHSHAIVWPSWQHTPRQYHGLRDDPEALRSVVRDRVREVAHFGKGVVVSHDVVNETWGHRDLMNILGEAEMAEWFKIVRQIDPQAVLYLNENTLEGGQKVDHVLKEVEMLRKHGAPIGGIGTQAHVNPMSIPVMLRNWQRLAEAGLPMMITEYDTLTPDPDLQGDFTRDLMIAWFSMPASTAFIMWGFWDGQHWLNNAPLFNRDWSLKPAGKHYIDLVFNQWWTNLSGTTDAQGALLGRGFLGDYEITVTHEGQTKVLTAHLAAGGTKVEVGF